MARAMLGAGTQPQYGVDGRTRCRWFPSSQAAIKVAARAARITKRDVLVSKKQIEDYGLSITSYRLVSPDGSMRRWERNEWLLPLERKTADGRIITGKE